jgi:DNA-binding GntR family transcriptional regulator
MAMELERPMPLYERVYQLLRQQIIQGVYEPGERVRESSTAESLRVSRTPVREALRLLEREGLLVTHGAEHLVINPTKEEYVDLYTCRMALENIVAERSASFATQTEVEAMSAALKDAKSASDTGDHAGVVAANTRFHDQMVESARMPPLRQLMQTIRGQILVARGHVLSDRDVEAAIWREHCELLQAIRESKVQKAQELMKLHMTNDVERGSRRFASSQEQ